MGLPPTAAHRDELAIRFFGRLSTSTPDRLLHHVFINSLRAAHASDRRLRPHNRSWCFLARATMERYGFLDQWQSGSIGDAAAWPITVRTAINLHGTRQWQRESAAKPSLELYCALKSTLKPEEWLLTHQSLQGRRLKLLARAGMLQLLPRIASITGNKHSPHYSDCECCSYAVAVDNTETIQHFLLECPHYHQLRTDMFQRIDTDLRNAYAGHLADFIRNNSVSLQLQILLGSRFEEHAHRFYRSLRKQLLSTMQHH